MTLKEFKEKYGRENVDTLVLGYTDKTVAKFVLIAMNDIDDIIYDMITNGKGERFRHTRKNNLYLRSLPVYKEIDMKELESYEGENFGLKAEKFLFGEIEKTGSLVDGILYGFKCQLKTSFNFGNGTSNSNRF